VKLVNRLLVNVLAIAVFVLPASAEILERVLVKVNGEILTKTELEQRQILALRQRNPQMRDEDVKNDAQLKKMLDDVTPDVLVDAIDEMLLLQRGKELGYRLSDEQFTQILENIKKENRLETEEQFRHLQSLECDQAQGFLFSRPVTGLEATAMLRAHMAVGPRAINA